MAEKKRCSECGGELPADAPQGLCPRCLMKAGRKRNSDASTASSDVSAGPSNTIGRYKLLRLIAEGGMGLVYLAEQREPVRRKVALKLIKPGMDSKQVIARFEMERQALALLDHPNIAHVFDAGRTRTGRPYFVMEYVKGESLTKHCDRQKLSIEQRLELFQQVCEAVQHAHQKGIIHRDIKPSNILVSVGGQRAVPKVIDFGIAKALTQPLTERTLFTTQGQLIGTPEYMSPEQADVAAQDIDTRADIYSLGVLLYELLTGALPFDRRELEQTSFAEIQRIIREEDPPRPSTRLSSLGEDAESVAESRRTEVAALAKRLHQELEWIPLKAMRKERSHRYRSASELADDIQNYLSGAPLIAGPESAVYRMKKFVRRKRALVTGIAAVLVALAAGVVVSTVFAIGQARARAQAEQAEKTAQQQRRIAETERDRAVEAERLAELRRAAEAVAAGLEAEQQAYLYFLPKEFLAYPEQKGVFRMFLNGQSVIINVVEDKLEGVPLTAAAVRELLATMYRTVSGYEAAASHLERAYETCQEQLGEENPCTLRCMRNLAAIYCEQGLYEQGEPLFVKTLETSSRALGEEHPNTLICMTDLADLYSKQGLHEKAEALRLKAEPLLVKTLEGLNRVLGEGHPGTLTFRNKLAEVYRDLGRYDEAEALLLDAAEINRRLRGEQHPYTLLSRNMAVELYEAWGKPEKAEEWRAKLPGKKATEKK